MNIYIRRRYHFTVENSCMLYKHAGECFLLAWSVLPTPLYDVKTLYLKQLYLVQICGGILPVGVFCVTCANWAVDNSIIWRYMQWMPSVGVFCVTCADWTADNSIIWRLNSIWVYFLSAKILIRTATFSAVVSFVLQEKQLKLMTTHGFHAPSYLWK